MKNLLTLIAKHSYGKHSFSTEWRVFIVLTLIVKAAAMLFSIFAGYFYFYDLLYKVLNSQPAAQTFSIVNLVLIEALTAIAISKFFKFVIRGTWKTAAPILIIVIGLFSISFISSTNGLALRQSGKVDHKELIVNDYEYQTNLIKSQSEHRAKTVKELIRFEQTNPQGWIGSKRAILTRDQLKRIDSYYQDLKTLAEEEKSKLAAITAKHAKASQLNKQIVETESNKFYNIVVVIMLIIFTVNGLLMFFYSKIYKEKAPQLVRAEAIESIKIKAREQAQSIFQNALKDEFTDQAWLVEIPKSKTVKKIGYERPKGKQVTRNIKN